MNGAAVRIVHSLHRRWRSAILNCVQLLLIDVNDWNDSRSSICLGSHHFLLLNRSSLCSWSLFVWLDFAEVKLGDSDEGACRSRLHILNRDAPLSSSSLLPSTAIILWLLHWVMVMLIWVLRQCVAMALTLWIIMSWCGVFRFLHLSFEVLNRLTLLSNFIIHLLSNLDFFLQLLNFPFHFR